MFEHGSSTPVLTVDTPGSVFDIDIRSGADGVRVAACAKHIHANTTGRGGDLFSIHLLDPAATPEGDGVGASGFSLGPNPFRAGGTMHFATPVSEDTAMDLFDASGRQVRSFTVPRGAGSFQWDGADDAGRPLPAGVYLVRIGSDSGTVTSSLVMTR